MRRQFFVAQSSHSDPAQRSRQRFFGGNICTEGQMILERPGQSGKPDIADEVVVLQMVKNKRCAIQRSPGVEKRAPVECRTIEGGAEALKRIKPDWGGRRCIRGVQ